MTAPGAGTPDGSYTPATVGGMQHMTETSIMAGLRGPVDGAAQGARISFWDVLGHVATALFGDGPGAPLPRLEDGMTDLNGRIELLDDVPGYAGGLLLHNHRFTGSGLRTIPFNKEYGPAKNAYLDTSDHRLYIAQGSWSCHFTISTGSGTAPFGVGHRARITVRDETGAVKIQREFTWQNNGSSWEQHYAIPIIAPVDGWSVQLEYSHSIGAGWWYVMGGTGKTLMWVERKNMDSLNWQPFDATNGPDIG